MGLISRVSSRTYRQKMSSSETLIASITAENRLTRQRAVENFKQNFASYVSDIPEIFNMFQARLFTLTSTPWTELDGFLQVLTICLQNQSSDHQNKIYRSKEQIEILRSTSLDLCSFPEVRIRENAGKLHASVCKSDSDLYRKS